MARFEWFGALAVAALAWAGCGLDCSDYCDQMDRCNGQASCDKSRCEDLCEETIDAGVSVGWEDQAQCALDVSCADLADGACLPDASLGIAWCEPG